MQGEVRIKGKWENPESISLTQICREGNGLGVWHASNQTDGMKQPPGIFKPWTLNLRCTLAGEKRSTMLVAHLLVLAHRFKEWQRVVRAVRRRQWCLHQHTPPIQSRVWQRRRMVCTWQASISCNICVYWRAMIWMAQTTEKLDKEFSCIIPHSIYPLHALPFLYPLSSISMTGLLTPQH